MNDQHRPGTGAALSQRLNRDCHCITLAPDKVRRDLERYLEPTGYHTDLLDRYQTLFGYSPVFLWDGHIEAMQRLVTAIEETAAMESYRRRILASAPAIAHLPQPNHGVFFGYDFHLSDDGPKLIEINTNAGGGLLNLYLSKAQYHCCGRHYRFKKLFSSSEEQVFVDMFRQEWRLFDTTRDLGTIAIVDDTPEQQFLYPEMLLFKSLFERNGIRAEVCDPAELELKGDGLWLGQQKIDLIYNRLTDFYLAEESHRHLALAYEQRQALFTPSPYHYALYADKTNLELLSDREALTELGAAQEQIGTLTEMIPASQRVTTANAEQLWQRRRELFFKPLNGYGSRGSYRGAKLTKGKWEQLLQSGYIAQEMIPPSSRTLKIDGKELELKIDLRCVVYNGRIQIVSARMYQGQTTNLRTVGGGLTPVFPIPENFGCCC